MKHIFNRIFLFLSIVWRDYEGSPLSLSTAWEVARIIHPPKKERLKREKEIQEILELVRKENDNYSDQQSIN